MMLRKRQDQRPTSHAAEQAARTYDTIQLRSAFWSGHDAARNGHPLRSCPYKDNRTGCGKVTWSRAYRKAWRHGWQMGRSQSSQVEPLVARSEEGGPH